MEKMVARRSLEWFKAKWDLESSSSILLGLQLTWRAFLDWALQICEYRCSTVSFDPVHNHSPGGLLLPCVQSRCPFSILWLFLSFCSAPLKSGLTVPVPVRLWMTTVSSHSFLFSGWVNLALKLLLCVRYSSSIIVLEGPSLGVISFLEISCVLGGPKLHTVLQMWACQCLIERRSRISVAGPMGQLDLSP